MFNEINIDLYLVVSMWSAAETSYYTYERTLIRLCLFKQIKIDEEFEFKTEIIMQSRQKITIFRGRMYTVLKELRYH